MPQRYCLLIAILFVFSPLIAQVGIGTSQPNPSAQLHVVSNDKGILLPQVSLTSKIDQQTISNGNIESLLVYNTSSTSDLNPGYYYWSGEQWSPLGDDSVYTGLGAPTSSSPDTPNAGAVYVDESTGDLYTFNGTSWIRQTLSVSNGLHVQNQSIRLGGDLDSPTVINTTENNTLSIKGLETYDNPEQMIVLDPETGILKKSAITNFFKEEVILHVATAGQTQFETPLFISDAKKVNVFRNGVRIDFTKINNTTIALEQGIICYANDEIRIVQFN